MERFATDQGPPMNIPTDNPSTSAADMRQNPQSTPRPRVYEKPVIRKYDQIDQVKPYGPSELEAG